MSRPVSLLDGPFAKEWVALGLGNHRVAFAVPERTATGDEQPRHFCGCGIEQRYCAPCSTWVCHAPGHLKHECGGAR